MTVEERHAAELADLRNKLTAATEVAKQQRHEANLLAIRVGELTIQLLDAQAGWNNAWQARLEEAKRLAWKMQMEQFGGGTSIGNAIEELSSQRAAASEQQEPACEGDVINDAETCPECGHIIGDAVWMCKPGKCLCADEIAASEKQTCKYTPAGPDGHNTVTEAHDPPPLTDLLRGWFRYCAEMDTPGQQPLERHQLRQAAEEMAATGSVQAKAFISNSQRPFSFDVGQAAEDCTLLPPDPSPRSYTNRDVLAALRNGLEETKFVRAFVPWSFDMGQFSG